MSPASRAWRSVLVLAVAMGAAGAEEEAASTTPDLALSEQQMRSMHRRIDADGNGKISMPEVMAFAVATNKLIASKDMGRVLEDLDVDNDGKLSMKEVLADLERWEDEDGEADHSKAAMVDAERRKFRAADADGDGFLSQAEMPNFFHPGTHDDVLTISAQFGLEGKDKNGDGKLSIEEFWGVAPGDEEGGVTEEEEAEFAKLDADGDGFIDIDELKQWESGMHHTEDAIVKLFDLSDDDGDQHLTADELVSARQQISSSDAHYHLQEWAEHNEL